MEFCEDKGTQSSKNAHFCFKQERMITTLLEAIKYYTIQQFLKILCLLLFSHRKYYNFIIAVVSFIRSTIVGIKESTIFSTIYFIDV